MDDILPGLIIEGVLGVEITHVPELSDNFYTAPVDDLAWYKRKVIHVQMYYVSKTSFSIIGHCYDWENSSL